MASATDIGESGPFVRLNLNAPAIAPWLRAGRFVLADLGGYLRTSLFPARLDGAAFKVLVRRDHPAAILCAGAPVNLIGPLGRGVEIPQTARRLTGWIAEGHALGICLLLLVWYSSVTQE